MYEEAKQLFRKAAFLLITMSRKRNLICATNSNSPVSKSEGVNLWFQQ